MLRLLTSLPLTGAATLLAQEPQVSRSPLNTLSDAEEVALGRKFGAELEKESKMLDVGPLNTYVNDIITRLGQKSQRPNLRYRARIIDSAVVNAVSLPGGYVYVYRGLLHEATSESELVGVLAHEVGHVAARHAANRIMLDFRARSLYEMVKKNLMIENNVITDIIQKMGGAVVMLALLQYGREAENEADMLGFYDMLRAGWDPRGMESFFRRLRTIQGRDPDFVEQILSTHPAPGQRAVRIHEELLKVRMPPDLVQDSLSFKTMKLGLSLLPAPPKAAPVRSRR
jgi:predicted Zn-dependent protease